MAGVKFYQTTSDKLASIEHEVGNLIFCKDVRKIYMDDSEGRTAYEQIMILATDEERTTRLRTLVSGFYFVLETNILWRLDDLTWIAITEKPSEQIVYGTLETFPRPGSELTLYRTAKSLYHWDPDISEYVDYCKGNPQWIIPD